MPARLLRLASPLTKCRRGFNLPIVPQRCVVLLLSFEYISICLSSATNHDPVSRQWNPSTAHPCEPKICRSQAFVRGILANWLVCIALWMASSSTSLPGKILGAYFPILTFVGIGFEHSVANMFFIPMVRAHVRHAAH